MTDAETIADLRAQLAEAQRERTEAERRLENERVQIRQMHRRAQAAESAMPMSAQERAELERRLAVTSRERNEAQRMREGMATDAALYMSQAIKAEAERDRLAGELGALREVAQAYRTAVQAWVKAIGDGADTETILSAICAVSDADVALAATLAGGSR